MITRGQILIERGTLLPEPLQLEDDSHPSGWASVANRRDRHQVEREVTAAGWTFFYMAGEIRAIAFGFDKKKMVHAALKRLIANVKLEKCNCLEIDAVVRHSFLGVPYMSVSAHSRHIQKGFVFTSNGTQVKTAV